LSQRSLVKVIYSIPLQIRRIGRRYRVFEPHAFQLASLRRLALFVLVVALPLLLTACGKHKY